MLSKCTEARGLISCLAPDFALPDLSISVVDSTWAAEDPESVPFEVNSMIMFDN